MNEPLQREVVTIDQAPTRSRSLSQGALSANEMKHQIGIIHDTLDNVMQKDVHYGKIPGSREPSLLKPGAEKIMTVFGLSADPQVQDISTDDKIHYRVKVSLKSRDGSFIGAGIGECSTDEEKYRWRAAVCPQEFEQTPEARRREKWKKGYQGRPPEAVKQVRTEPADLANTVLKMAKKRALVDAVLTCTAASDCFTQDIEDLPPEYLNPEPAAPPPSNEAAQQRSEPLSKERVTKFREMIFQHGLTEQEVFAGKSIQRFEDVLDGQANGLFQHIKKLVADKRGGQS